MHTGQRKQWTSNLSAYQSVAWCSMSLVYPEEWISGVQTEIIQLSLSSKGYCKHTQCGFDLYGAILLQLDFQDKDIYQANRSNEYNFVSDPVHLLQKKKIINKCDKMVLHSNNLNSKQCTVIQQWLRLLFLNTMPVPTLLEFSFFSYSKQLFQGS